MGSDSPLLIYCYQALGGGGSPAGGRPGKAENAAPRAPRPPRHTANSSFRSQRSPGGGGPGKARVQFPEGDTRRGRDNGRRAPSRGRTERPARPAAPGGSRGGSELGARPRRGAAPSPGPRGPGAEPAAGTERWGPRGSRPTLDSPDPDPRPRPQHPQAQGRPARLTCLPTVWLASCFMRLNCFFMAAAARGARAGQLAGRLGAATSLPGRGGGGDGSRAGAPPSSRHFQRRRPTGAARGPTGLRALSPDAARSWNPTARAPAAPPPPTRWSARSRALPRDPVPPPLLGQAPAGEPGASCMTSGSWRPGTATPGRGTRRSLGLAGGALGGEETMREEAWTRCGGDGTREPLDARNAGGPF